MARPESLLPWLHHRSRSALQPQNRLPGAILSRFGLVGINHHETIARTVPAPQFTASAYDRSVVRGSSL